MATPKRYLERITQSLANIKQFNNDRLREHTQSLQEIDNLLYDLYKEVRWESTQPKHL